MSKKRNDPQVNKYGESYVYLDGRYTKQELLEIIAGMAELEKISEDTANELTAMYHEQRNLYRLGETTTEIMGDGEAFKRRAPKYKCVEYTRVNDCAYINEPLPFCEKSVESAIVVIERLMVPEKPKEICIIFSNGMSDKVDEIINYSPTKDQNPLRIEISSREDDTLEDGDWRVMCKKYLVICNGA